MKDPFSGSMFVWQSVRGVGYEHDKNHKRQVLAAVTKRQPVQT